MSGIKNDKWIRKMAGDVKMIDPFEPGQVRMMNDQKVISYGTSSYGYDIRCSREFKIFTPNWSVVVDPKEFDEKSFVSHVGDVCIIPPNSFVLARTLECFSIPRNILTICLGKSTLARCGIIVNVTPFEPCLSADSEALTIDGWVPIGEIKVGDSVLTRNEEGFAEYKKVDAIQARPFKGELLHFEGKSVDQLVTPDHKLLVWFRNCQQNTESIRLTKAKDVFGKHNYSFDRFVEWRGTSDHPSEICINGLSFPRRVFLVFLGCYLGDGSAYLGSDGGYHVKLAVVTKERKRDFFRDVLERLGVKAREHERGFEFFSKPLAQYLMQFGHAREKYLDRAFMNLAPEELRLILEGLMESDGCQSTMSYSTTSRRLADDVQELAFKCGAAAIVREVRNEIDGNAFDAFVVRICETHMTPKMPPINHKLVPYDGMVYDMTVPNHVFFCRRKGKASWTGNCWRGHATLEFSNTTPLPVKIYANEGCAQLIFLEADEECETSYADRLGKYQDQVGVVGPRI